MSQFSFKMGDYLRETVTINNLRPVTLTKQNLVNYNHTFISLHSDSNLSLFLVSFFIPSLEHQVLYLFLFFYHPRTHIPSFWECFFCDSCFPHLITFYLFILPSQEYFNPHIIHRLELLPCFFSFAILSKTSSLLVIQSDFVNITHQL